MRMRTDEVINSVLWTHERYILPNLSDEYAHSLALTTSNLLRHVALRIELEYELMTDEREDLLAVLAEARSFAATLDACPPALAAAVQESRGPDGAGEREQRALFTLADRLELLWQRLNDLLVALQVSRSAIGHLEGYRHLREQLLACLGRQLDREKLTIDGAFTGERR